MSEQKVSNVGPSRIEMAYELFGSPGAEPVLLIMGLGAQMLGWREEFCEALVDHGLQVIRFDNRDAGLSTHLSDAPVPNLQAVLAGDHSSVSYTLSEMAQDSVGLLDVLGLEGAHLVGASMGGMIAQTIAIEYPERVRSLTSIMSTTGNRSVGQPHPEALSILLGPSPKDRDGAIDRGVAALRAISSPGFAFDEAEVRDRMTKAYDRAYDPLGMARQAAAVVASGDRTAALETLEVSTLVIHGADDRMCDVSGGRATAAALPGAELVIIEGMGHDLPRPLWPRITSLIAQHVERASAR